MPNPAVAVHRAAAGLAEEVLRAVAGPVVAGIPAVAAPAVAAPVVAAPVAAVPVAVAPAVVVRVEECTAVQAVAGPEAVQDLVKDSIRPVRRVDLEQVQDLIKGGPVPDLAREDSIPPVLPVVPNLVLDQVQDLVKDSIRAVRLADPEAVQDLIKGHPVPDLAKEDLILPVLPVVPNLVLDLVKECLVLPVRRVDLDQVQDLAKDLILPVRRVVREPALDFIDPDAKNRQVLPTIRR